MIEFDNAGNPTGELLESWEAKPGAVEWIFNVRKGIKFSNGKTLDADDIRYSPRWRHQITGQRHFGSNCQHQSNFTKSNCDHPVRW
ncbi:MAG: ABC transporter substrate-binding protein [Rhodobacterales bacterium]